MGSFFGLRSAFFFCKFFNRNTLPQKIPKETARNTLYNRTTKSRPQGGFEDAWFTIRELMFCLVALGGYYQSSQFAHMKLFIQMWQGSGFTNLWYRWDLWIMKLKFLFQQLHPEPRPLSQSDAWVGGFPSKRNGKGQRSWRRHVNSKIWNKEARRHTLSWDSCVSFETYGAVKKKN